MKASLSDHKQQGIAVMKRERQWMASRCPGLCTVSHQRQKKPFQGHGCLKAVQPFPQAHELEPKLLTHCAQQHRLSEPLLYFKWSQDDDAFKGTAGSRGWGWGGKSGVGGERRKKMQPGERCLTARGMLCCLWPPDFLRSWLPCSLLQDSKKHYHGDR